MRDRTTITFTAIARLLLLGTAAYVTASCRATGESRILEFASVPPVDADTTSELLPNVRLSRVESLAGLSAKIKAYRDERPWTRDIFQPHLRVVIEAPTRAEFDTLQAAYGFGLSRVKYTEGTSYELRDFLTPFMQATLDTFFRQEIDSHYDQLASNCWTTGYESIRTAAPEARGFSVFFAEAGSVDAVLTDPRYSSEVASFAADAPKGSQFSDLETASLEFGDLLLFYDQSGVLYHVAVHVDQGIMFEKVAVISHAPYRLTTWADSYYRPQPGHRIAVRRYHDRKLPEPSTVLKTKRQVLSSDAASVHIEEVPLLSKEISWQFDSSGRARLPASAFAPQLAN